jgi:hypothetical protein
MFNNITKYRFALAVLIAAALTIAIYRAGTTEASVNVGMCR